MKYNKGKTLLWCINHEWQPPKRNLTYSNVMAWQKVWPGWQVFLRVFLLFLFCFVFIFLNFLFCNWLHLSKMLGVTYCGMVKIVCDRIRRNSHCSKTYILLYQGLPEFVLMYKCHNPHPVTRIKQLKIQTTMIIYDNLFSC